MIAKEYGIDEKIRDEIVCSFGIIYKITNIINGKVYIGKTIRTIKERLTGHFNKSKTKKYPLYYAIRKYGWENFECGIIDVCNTEDELNEKEQFYISLHRSYVGYKDSNGYNATIGGEGGLGRGIALEPDDILEIKEYLITKELSPKQIANIFKVDLSTIYSINNGQSWRHIDVDGFERLPKSYFYRGEGNSQAKLDIQRVIKIKELIRDTNLTLKTIAEKIGVCTEGAIKKIYRGQTWADVKVEGFIPRMKRDTRHKGYKNRLLHDEDIFQIKRLLIEGSLTYKQIGGLFNISVSSISNIKKGVLFKDIEVDGFEEIKNKERIKKLTKQNVLEIRKLLEEGSKSHKYISEKYEVSRSMITLISQNKTWQI